MRKSGKKCCKCEILCILEPSSTSDEGKVKMSYADKYQEYKKFCIANNLKPINFMSFCSLVRRNVLENHKQVLLDSK